MKEEHIITVEGRECWNLACEDLAFRNIGDSNIIWHFRPYSDASAKNLLRAISNKYAQMPSGGFQQIPGDPVSYLPFFDAHFLRMENVFDELGNALPLETQLQWLEENPQAKVQCIEGAFNPELVVSPDIQSLDGKAVLLFSKLSASKHKVKAWWGGAVHEIEITHKLASPKAKDRLEYDRSTTNRIESRRNTKTLQVVRDFDLIESLYAKLIDSMEGACVWGKPCLAENKAEWIAKVPYWWKFTAVEDIFSQDRSKNV